MDLDLALWRISPLFEYRLNETKTAIVEWRSEQPQPTDDELAAAWTQYQQDQADAAAQAVSTIQTQKAQRAALIDTILSRPAIASDTQLQSALAAFLAQFA